MKTTSLRLQSLLLAFLEFETRGNDMSKLSHLQQKIGDLLTPYGLYFQSRTLEEEGIQGYPIEPGLLTIAGLALGTFFYSFFKEFGAECGRQAGKIMSDWLQQTKGSNSLSNSGMQMSESDQLIVVEAFYDAVKKEGNATYFDLRPHMLSAMKKLLVDQGVPSRRSVEISEKILLLIEEEAGLPF